MPRRVTKNCCWALALLVASTTAAYAAPTDTSVDINYLDHGSDKCIDVVFRVTLRLTPISNGTDFVEWRIAEAEFSEPQSGRTWATGPLLVSNSADGSWTVAHRDPDQPLASEFNALPSISGLAESNQQDTPSLEFSLKEGQRTLAPEQPPYGSQTGFSTHTYRITGEAAPEEDGDDEPVIVGTTHLE